MTTTPNSKTETVRENYDLQCPTCKDDNSLIIQFTTWGELSPQGLTDNGAHEWGLDSLCRCDACSHHGVVRDFYIGNEMGEPNGSQSNA
jgi:hypothetical protein